PHSGALPPVTTSTGDCQCPLDNRYDSLHDIAHRSRPCRRLLQYSGYFGTDAPRSSTGGGQETTPWSSPVQGVSSRVLGVSLRVLGASRRASLGPVPCACAPPGHERQPRSAVPVVATRRAKATNSSTSCVTSSTASA